MADENTLLNSDLESRYEKYKGIIKNFTLMSDIFMRNVFKQRECLEYVLQVIMEKQDLRVIDQIIQKDYKNMQGRSAVMDCVARDSEGKQFDVEIQQDNEGASPKRARYHSGLMDMNTLNPGQDFDELPESYVIFIPEMISLDMDFRFTILTDRSRRLTKHSRMKHISYM